MERKTKLGEPIWVILLKFVVPHAMTALTVIGAMFMQIRLMEKDLEYLRRHVTAVEERVKVLPTQPEIDHLQDHIDRMEEKLDRLSAKTPAGLKLSKGG